MEKLCCAKAAFTFSLCMGVCSQYALHTVYFKQLGLAVMKSGPSTWSLHNLFLRKEKSKKVLKIRQNDLDCHLPLDASVSFWCKAFEGFRLKIV